MLQKYKELKEHILSNGDISAKMVTDERFDNILKLCQIIKDKNIEGDFLEAGVYRGSVSIFLCKILEAEFPDKVLFACDSFCGCENPKTATYQYEKETHWEGLYSCDFETVVKHFNIFGCDFRKVIFMKGYFKDTLPVLKNEIDKISLLIFDGDAYSATLDVFNNLYDKVIPGGFIIIDDYCISGCRLAFERFAKEKQLNIKLKHPITHKILEPGEEPSGAWFQKC